MSKIEKFISDCTRTCSNELSEVNNTICGKIKVVNGYHPWLTPDQARKVVEIARDEMMEKVCSFIDDNMAEYINIKGYTGNTFIDIESDRFIKDLKQAIKDEC